MQLLTIIGLIPSVRLNDARANRSSLSRQTEDLILPYWRTEEKANDDFAPVILVAINTIQNAQTKKAMVALLDTGSTRSFIHRSCLPSAAAPTLSKKPLISNTAAGKLESQTKEGMTGIVCPEFILSKRMDALTAYVIESPCHVITT
eukprot:scaffold184224_cov24-Attheya_sp.AAC.3